MNGTQKVECPKCLGTGFAYTGKFMKPCKVCKDGKVDLEIEEAFVGEGMQYE